jgi:hypothetical protein
MSDAVMASNDVYLAQRFESLSEDDLRRRIDAWWQRFLSDPATRRFWSLRVPSNLVAGDGAGGLIDSQSFLRTARAIRATHERLRSAGRATADLVRLERLAAELCRDFVRRGIVRSYQLRDSMWYEPVWVLAFQNGYCVDYADWFYWTASLLGLNADVVLASTPRARDYADHVLNLVTYADGSLELVEPQNERGYGSLAWVLVQTRSDGTWKLARMTPAEIGKRDAAHVQGLGVYAIEALRYQQRAQRTLEGIGRCTFNPTFSDQKKYSTALGKATDALARSYGYADVSGAGQVHYQAAILLAAADLYRLDGQQELAHKFASTGESICEDCTQASYSILVRIDASYMQSRYLVERAPCVRRDHPTQARQLLEAAERSLRTAVDLGAESRWKHFEYNFDLRMAEIRNLQSQIRRTNDSNSVLAVTALSENEQARVHAEKAVAAHRELREKLDADLGAGNQVRGSGIFNRRAFRKRADRFLRESYLTLGDVHQTRALLLSGIVRQQDPPSDKARTQATFVEARKHLRTALDCFLKRSQADDITGQPDRMRTHEARIHLACVSIELGELEDAKLHVAAAKKDADEIRQHTPDPRKLRKWMDERSRLLALLDDAHARSGHSDNDE